MLKLDLKKEPYWLELPATVRTLVRPLTTAIMSAAQSAVIKEIIALREERKKRLAAGADVSDLPDVENEEARMGLAEALLIKAVARLAILAWEAVLSQDGESPAPVIPQTVNDLMDIWFIAEDFWKQYTGAYTLLETEGNGSRPVANGTSAAGRTTAKAARRRNSPAAEAKREKTESVAPTS
jgi:hypothetical protein